MNSFNMIPMYKDMGINDPVEQQKVGYFDDGFGIDNDSRQNLLTLCEWIDSGISAYITSKIMGFKGSNKPIMLLVYFGCFAPFHEGHAFCVNSAIEKFEEHYKIVGCLLLQSHDNYIISKKHVTKENIKQFSYIDADFMMKHGVLVDNFSKSFCGELNFPYLLVHAMAYFNLYPNIDYKLGVIVGEDNKDFSRVKHNQILYHVVSRSDALLNPYWNTSSTSVRESIINDTNNML